MFLVLEEIGLPSLTGWKVVLLFENCVAAARAPAIAVARLSDLFVSDELGLLAEEASDPGFKEKGLRESGRGNFTGSGDVTGVRPLTAASYTFLSKL